MAKILIVTRNYPPVICGVGDHSAHLKTEWEVKGHSVSILTVGNPTQSTSSIFFTPQFDGHLQAVIADLLLQEAIEVIFWQYVPYGYQAKGLPRWWPRVMAALRPSGVRQVIFFHEVSIRVFGHGFRHLLLACGQRLIANRANRVANASFTSLALYRSYFVEPQPGIVPISANIEGIQNSFGKQEHSESRTTLFCFANRADEALLQAVGLLKDKYQVSLVLGGALPPSQQLKIAGWAKQYQVEHLISITGPLPAAELSRHIADATIFMLPQLVEKNNEGGVSAKNGTVMAAMQMGKPIITCRGDMTDDSLFRDKDNLLFVGYGNTSDYTQGIETLLTDPAFAVQLGNNAALTYKNTCSWKITAAQLAEAF